MKASRFNVPINYEGCVILYNSFKDNFILLDPKLYELFIKSVSEDKISNLIDSHPDFYNTLKINGQIIDKNIDEILELKKVSEKKDNDDSRFQLTINPTTNCNFKCWYCYENHNKNSKMSFNIQKNVLLFIDNLLKSDKLIRNFHISFFGGEPLLYFHECVLPIMTKSKEICQNYNVMFSTSFTTNGFLINQNIATELKKYFVEHIQITLDGHEKEHNLIRRNKNGSGSYKKIIENIFLLSKNSIKVFIRINYSNKNIENIKNIAQDFLHFDTNALEYITFSFHKVWQEKDTKILRDRVIDNINYFRELGFKATSNLIPNYVFNPCYADKRNHALINFNGDVFKCTARDFKTENKEGVLTENGIQWNEKYYDRLNIKFKNIPCMDCIIMPICNGGCSQHAIENRGKNYCVYNFDRERMLEVALYKCIESFEG